MMSTEPVLGTAELDWTFPASSCSPASLAHPDYTDRPAASAPSLTSAAASSTPTNMAAWAARGMLGTGPHAWDQLLVRAGTGNGGGGGGVTSRGGVRETDDNANWRSKDCGVDASWSSESARQRQRRATPRTATGSSSLPQDLVFSELDYDVVRRHVMQDDVIDDHVMTGADRKSLQQLDCRKLTTTLAVFIIIIIIIFTPQEGWLGSRVVSVLDSGA